MNDLWRELMEETPGDTRHSPEKFDWMLSPAGFKGLESVDSGDNNPTRRRVQ